MILGRKLVTVRRVRVHCPILMLSLFVVLRSLLVLTCRKFIMLGSLLVVFGTLVFSHRISDVTRWSRRSGADEAFLCSGSTTRTEA